MLSLERTCIVAGRCLSASMFEATKHEAEELGNGNVFFEHVRVRHLVLAGVVVAPPADVHEVLSKALTPNFEFHSLSPS